MNTIKPILIYFLIQSFASEALRCKSCIQRKADLPVDELRQLRFEYLKNQILKKLHLTEPPKTNLPKPPLKSLLVIAEMAENETILETVDQPKTESVVLYPKNANLTCIGNQSYPCSRFEFIVPGSLTTGKFISAEVWLYKKNLNNFIKVYRIKTGSSRRSQRNFELNNTLMENNIRHWTKYILPSDSFKSDFSNEIVLTLEVTGTRNMTYFESVVGETGDEKPFLIIRSEVSQESSRRRRSTTCVESSTSCCKENFFLNFSEIGWDNWILHPDGYQANFCRGRCFNDLSNTRFYHSAVLLSYIRDNKDIAEEIGLNMCCTPSVMAPVTIIYRNEEGLIYHKSIENMKVEACDCA